MAVKEVILPKLGQTMETGIIVEWMKQEGDFVERGEVLFTLESDKATLEVESPTKGYLRKILVPADEERPVLSVVALMTKTLDEDVSDWQVGESTSPQAEKSASERITESTGRESEASPPAAVSAGEQLFASPRARRVAREKGIELALIAGSGPNGRIVERDVVAYLESAPRATPVALRVAELAGVDLRTVQGSGPGGKVMKADVLATSQAPSAAPQLPTPPAYQAEVPVSGVRAVIARRMFAGASETAPVTLTIEADATEFVALREQLKVHYANQLGFNIGYNDLLIKLVAHALREFPYVNAQLDQEAGVIRRLNEVHVALAVDTERGLLVPVVRDADRKPLTEVAIELRGVIERARAGTALPDELSGSTFTITNLGMLEIDAFTPIINLPEAAILGVGRIKDRPAVMGGELVARKQMWLSLTFDHRLVDGAPAARFLQYIKNLIETPSLWLAATM
jgi:pyruvate dehydrogenase E2 component (dihydrolipoamide acetyltransferase)